MCVRDVGGQSRSRIANVVCASLLFCGAVDVALAETFSLGSQNDSVVGVPLYVKAGAKDTLMDMARASNLGYDDMRQANPSVDMWVPGAGADVMLPKLFVLPNAARKGIVINRAEKRLYFYPADRPNDVDIYTISVGKDAMGTPLGSFTVIEKRENPTWTPGPGVRAAHAAYGDILPATVPPGPDNPLGRFAMRLSNPDYLIHGTSKPWGLGMEVSGGCIRMYPEGVEELYPKVAIDTPVVIIDQPYKVGWHANDLYLEVQTGEKSIHQSAESVIPDAIKNDASVKIDWTLVEQVVAEDSGIPMLVGRRETTGTEADMPMVF
jgi:L,D-transpeptidase ErfK/SrfK